MFRGCFQTLENYVWERNAKSCRYLKWKRLVVSADDIGRQLEMNSCVNFYELKKTILSKVGKDILMQKNNFLHK